MMPHEERELQTRRRQARTQTDEAPASRGGTEDCRGQYLKLRGARGPVSLRGSRRTSPADPSTSDPGRRKLPHGASMWGQCAAGSRAAARSLWDVWWWAGLGRSATSGHVGTVALKHLRGLVRFQVRGALLGSWLPQAAASTVSRDRTGTHSPPGPSGEVILGQRLQKRLLVESCVSQNYE